MRTRFILAALLLPLALNARAQTASPYGANPQVRHIVVAGGAIQGNTYTNKSIGLSYDFPGGWRAETPALPKEFHGEPAVVLDAAPSSASKSGIRLLITPWNLLPDDRHDASKFVTWLVGTWNNTGAGITSEVVGPINPLEVGSHSFVRAAVHTHGAGNADSFADIFAGPVNGLMVVLEVLAPAQAETNDLADAAVDALSFFPPDDPEDASTDTVVIRPNPSAVKRITITEAAARARVRTKVEPRYPAEARDRGVEGEVLLDVVVAADGSVAEATVLTGHPLLTGAALEAVKQWKFEPMTSAGAPAETETKVRVRFSLTSARRSS